MDKILGGLFSGLIGNLLNWQLVQGYIRNILLALGGAVGLEGYVGEDGSKAIVGSIMIILGVLFSAVSNNTKVKAIEVVKAVDEAPDVLVIPAEETVSGKPKVMANGH